MQNTISSDRGKLKIFHSSGLVAVFLFLLVRPTYFGQFPALARFYTYSSFLVVLILITLILQGRRITRHMLWIIAFFGIEMIITALNGGGNLYAYMRDNFPALGVCLLFCLWMEKNPQALMEGFGILEFYIYINLLTMLLFPNGLYKTELYTENWFLGYKEHTDPDDSADCVHIIDSVLSHIWKNIRTYKNFDGMQHSHFSTM